MLPRARRYAVLFLAALSLVAPPAPAAPAAPTPQSILAQMERVEDWQLANMPPESNRPLRLWATGVYDAGVMALANISGDRKYLDAMLDAGTRTKWQLGPERYFADDATVGQMYTEMYARFHEAAMIAPARERLDDILANPPPQEGGLYVARHQSVKNTWSWCDALFMGPPLWARMSAVTGDPKYLAYADAHIWETVAFLYDQREHLFYRDSSYFGEKEANGQPVFWGRGNGWAIAGIARVLQVMPGNAPARPKYVALLRELAARLRGLQDAGGAWHASLLDPASYPEPEMSSTALIAFAFAWGMNAGILDPHSYAPATFAAWHALGASVQDDGMLGRVQPIGENPVHTSATSTDIFGIGAFLLAGAEIYKYQLLAQAPHLRVSVTNPLDRYRPSETITLTPRMLAKLGARLRDLIVVDGASGRIVDSQVTTARSGALEDALIFQTDSAPRARATFEVVVKPRGLATPAPLVKTFARYVPERQDDFAWENDRIAHRVYGPALAQIEGTNNSGIDVWVKSVRRPVVDEFYRDAHYHVDHGAGGDFYDNGASRGDGGSGVWSGDTLYVSNNYATQYLVSSGPIRAEFVLTYAPWQAGERTVTSTKRFILDAGSNMTRIIETFSSTQPGPIDVGVAVVTSDWHERHVHSKQTRNLARAASPPEDLRGSFVTGPNWIADFQGLAPAPAGAPDNGMAGVGVVLAPPARATLGYADGHVVLSTQTSPGRPLTYFAGAGWSKFDFPTAQAWQTYIADFARRAAMPLLVQPSL